MMSDTFKKCLALIVCTITIGCASDGIPTADRQNSAVSRFALEERDYRIGVDDQIQVNVWKNPDLAVTAPVRPDGRISVPLIGDVVAGGKTPPELAAVIREKLSVYLRDPHVTVIVTQLNSHEFLTRVRVTGAVRTPRSLPFRQGMTVLDAVLEAGGPNEFASPNRTKLYRSTKTGNEVFEIELGDILNRGRLQTNFTLLPGDVVTVPERIF